MRFSGLWFLSGALTATGILKVTYQEGIFGLFILAAIIVAIIGAAFETSNTSTKD